MSEHIHKSHNKSLLLYHFVCPIKYRRKVLSAEVSSTFKDVCLKIEERYEIHFLEIGLDEDRAELSCSFFNKVLGCKYFKIDKNGNVFPVDFYQFVV